MKARAFLVRLATGLVTLAIILSLIWVPTLFPIFALFVSLLVAFGIYEFYAMSLRVNIIPEVVAGIALGTLVTFSGWYGGIAHPSLALGGSFIIVFVLHMARGRQSLAGLATTLFGIVYVGYFGAHFVLIRAIHPDGPGLITLLIASVAVTDAAAYIVGSSFGRHKLAPSISPGKTWEGAVGGFFFSLVAVCIFYLVSLELKMLPQWPVSRYVLVGGLLSVVGQIGDLAESCLKRSVGVKDSGILFPGHGGVLDRCDSYLFSAPVLYYLALWVV